MSERAIALASLVAWHRGCGCTFPLRRGVIHSPREYRGRALFGLGVGNAISVPPVIANLEFSHDDATRAVASIVAISQGGGAYALHRRRSVYCANSGPIRSPSSRRRRTRSRQSSTYLFGAGCTPAAEVTSRRDRLEASATICQSRTSAQTATSPEDRGLSKSPIGEPCTIARTPAHYRRCWRLQWQQRSTESLHR